MVFRLLRVADAVPRLTTFASPCFPRASPALHCPAGKHFKETSVPKITKRVLDALRPSVDGKDIFLWDAGDGSLKGFGVRLKPSGAASYFVQYRNKETRTRRLVLGRVGTLTPDEARRLAGDALRDVAKGNDPSAERHAVRGAMTVSELCDLYLLDAKTRIKASTLAADKSRIETHV